MPNLGNERWRDVALSPYGKRYEVSDKGRVRSKDHIDDRGRFLFGKLRKQVRIPNGYWSVQLHYNGHRKLFYVHSLVLISFTGPRPLELQCRHLDDDPSNNCWENLVWGTRIENADDRDRNGRTCKGESHVRSSLTNNDIIEIYSNNTVSKSELSEKFGVSLQTIYRIKNKETRKHLLT